MQGLLPRDEELIKAQSPDPEGVLGARFRKGDGGLQSTVPCADAHEFAHLVNHALKLAQRQIDAIRGGEAAVSPASLAGTAPAPGASSARHACLTKRRMRRSSAG